MTTAQILKLYCNGSTLDLMSSPYSIGNDFSIPAINAQAAIAVGSSANVYGGGVEVARKYKDRAWSFNVRVLGTTDAQIRLAARTIENFILQGTPDAPCYVVFSPSSDTPEPLWGNYGTYLYYEIVSLQAVTVSPNYAAYGLRRRMTFVTISVEIKPFAQSKSQRACTATGGIMEDLVGGYGVSKGVFIPEATTNKLTNPNFAVTGSTPDSGWTASSGFDKSYNRDQQYIIPGAPVSINLNCRTASATYTMFLNVGNTNPHSLSAYVKLPDGGTVSSTQVQLYYSATGALTTTYTALGDGWYLLKSENFSGSNSLQNVGVVGAAGYTFYLGAMQLEEKAYATPIGWGDLAGWAWSGTVNASTSSRTAASCKIPANQEVISAAQGSFRAIVRFDVANTHTNYMFLFDTRDGTHLSALCLFFNPSDDKLYLQTNTSTYTASGALTFSAGTIYVIHATWSASGAVLYINGSQVDTDAYVANALASNLFIGSDYASGNQINGVTLEAGTFDRALTATQVANDYANLQPLISAGTRPGTVPWFWTYSGDNILSLDTNKKPLGLVAGVPGNLPALTEMQGNLSSGWNVIKSIGLNAYPAEIQIPQSRWLNDLSGCAAAGDYGGSHYRGAATSDVFVDVGYNYGFYPPYSGQMSGADFYQFTRIKVAAGNPSGLYVKTAVKLDAETNQGDQRLVSAASTYRLFRTALFSFPDKLSYFNSGGGNYVQATLYLKTPSGSAAVDLDYEAIVARPFFMLTAASDATGCSFVFKRMTGKVTSYSYSAACRVDFYGTLTTQGDILEFAPNQYNHVLCLVGTDETIDPLTTYQVSLDALYVTPRWALV